MKEKKNLEKVVIEHKNNKLVEIVRGNGIPLLGGFFGYYVTKNFDIATIGMTLTSLGMATLENDKKKTENPITIDGYRTWFVIGLSTELAKVAYHLFK